MRIRNVGAETEKVDLQMTPMIDIVFQLLIFFVMTFKIVAIEGDFSIKMPLGAPTEGPSQDLLPPIRVRLVAGENGEIAGIRLGERPVSSFNALHDEIMAIVGGVGGPGSVAESAEVELDCDYDLNYEYVIAAITAVSGYVDENGRIVKLIEKIKFAPPRTS